jgi:rhomboid protease GluP
MRRLEEPLNLMRAPLSPALERLLRQVVIRHDRTPIRLFGTRNAWTTPVVVILILLNLAMFVAEITLGGSTNSYTLYRLGAVDAFSILAGGEYWRLAASLFLHYGSLHLIFNMYALTVIGPGLEQAIGAIRFAICYLVSGLGSSTGALTLYFFGFGRTDPLVGASGCVMGLVGVWAGLFLRHRDAPNASRRLKNILVIVVIQTAFDLSTPQVSMAAHMSGFLTGVVLGLIISPKALPE